LQGGTFAGQGAGLDLQLLLQLFLVLANIIQLALKRLLLFLEADEGLLQRLLGLFLQALRQAPHQLAQLFIQRQGPAVAPAGAIVQLLEVAMDGGFRTGIAHFDAYGVDAGVFAAGKNRLTRFLHHRLVYASASHASSDDFVL